LSSLTVHERLVSVKYLNMLASAFGQHSQMWFDPETAQLYQEVALPEELRNIPPSFWRFPCRKYCEKKLRRVHAHCLLACRVRKVWRKKIPAVYPIRIYAPTIRLNRPHAHQRDMIMKRLSEALEWLAG